MCVWVKYGCLSASTSAFYPLEHPHIRRCARPHFTPDLHWLPIKQRIEFKLCLLVHKTLVGHSPEYISDLLTSAADVSGWPTLRAASRGDFIVPWTNRKFGDSILRRSSSSVEWTATRPQTAAFDADIQASSQDIFYSLFLTELR